MLKDFDIFNAYTGNLRTKCLRFDTKFEIVLANWG